MAEILLKEGERRRSPRFHCGGMARLYCLPLDGNSLRGEIHDLSVGGMRLGLIQPLEVGRATEVVVAVNAESFRAAALVKGLHPLCGTRLEFTRIGDFGKEILADLVQRLATMQSLNRKLRAPQMEKETAQLLLKQEIFQLVRRGDALASAGEKNPGQNETDTKRAEEGDAIEGKPLVIQVDVFV
jgi:hypothetical protein